MKKDNKITVLEQQLACLLKCDLMPSNSYLAGGTATYFYFNHRLSLDLDFFTSSRFRSESIVSELKSCFSEFTIELIEEYSVIAFISEDKIKLSLFHLSYPLLNNLTSYKLADGTVCPLASINDLEAMKAIAIAQRGSARDFIDFYELISHSGHSMQEVLEAVLKKYDLKSDYEYHLKTSFVYFDDADRELDQIIMINKNKKLKKLTSSEWIKIKSFYNRFIQ